MFKIDEQLSRPATAGSFVRPPSRFRDWISSDGSTAYPAEAGRYHLYLAHSCPWAHRTLIGGRPEGSRGRDRRVVREPNPRRARLGVHRGSYEEIVEEMFSTLDELDERLTDRRYLFGDRPVETDWRLFVTLVRFDAVYYIHFKCSRKRVTDYPNLWPYVRDLVQEHGIADTIRMDEYRQHYYRTHDTINPRGIMAVQPAVVDFTIPHGREALSAGD